MIDVLCFPESEAIFRMQPRVQRVFTNSRGMRGISRLFHQIRLAGQLRARNYELVAQFSDDWRGAWISRFLGAPLSVAGRSSKRPALWHHSFNQIAPRPVRPRHSAELDVDLLRRVGLYGVTKAPPYRLCPDQEAAGRAKQFLQDHGIGHGRLVVVHSAARWRFKGLPAQTWVVLIQALLGKGFDVVISGSDLDFPNNEKLGREAMRISTPDKPPGRVAVCRGFSLPDTATLYGLAKAVVSIDSLAVHLASAMGSPVFAIFGPSGEDHWHPWRVAHKIYAQTRSFSCRPCGMDGCAGTKKSQCLESIDPRDLASEVLNFLNGLRPVSP